LVEHCTENAGVGGSIPPLGTITTFHGFSLLRIAYLKDQKIVLNEGYLYRVTALQFKEDKRIGWAAERTFAVRGRSDRSERRRIKIDLFAKATPLLGIITKRFCDVTRSG
jgi:hypothetical protein